MATIKDRTLAILDLLARNTEGLQISEVAKRLEIPLSASHRLLAELKEGGYVRQIREGGVYVMTAKLLSISNAYLEGHGITDVVQPILEDLARATGELVRIAVIDEDHLTWVAKAQGARHGLRYDPDAGTEVYLAATANGFAWLSCLTDEAALELVAKQGFRNQGFGPNAPHTIQDVLQHVQEAREAGYGMVVEAYEAGTSAIAAPIIRPRTGEPTGTVSIAGPSLRLSKQRLQELAPLLLESARELSMASGDLSRFRSDTVFSGTTGRLYVQG